jgi:hypothetical protein
VLTTQRDLDPEETLLYSKVTYVITIFIFDLDFDHQRDEALLQESFQVQETISGINTWAWACNFDIDAHNKHH